MRQHVERDLVRINFLRHWLLVDDLVDLTFQFFERFCARAGHGLIARGEDAFHAERLMQRIQRHERDGRGAIWIGDDAFVFLHIGSVDFRHDERDTVVLTERAGIVHHHTTGFGCDGRKLPRNVAARAEQRDVDARERILGQFGDRDVCATKFERLAHRTGGRKQGEFAHGKIALLQRLDHFDADCTRRADNCYMRILVHKRR